MKNTVLLGTLFLWLMGCGDMTSQLKSLTKERIYENLTTAPLISVENSTDLTTITPTLQAPLTYEIVEGTGTIIGDTFTPSPSGGTVIIAIKDANGVIQHVKFEVAPALAVEPAQTQLSEDSVFDFSGSAGVPPYTYSATGGTIDSGGIFSPDPGATSATVTVTDSLNNTKTLTITINPPLTSTATLTTIAANNSSTVSGQDGVGPYTYSMSSGPGSVNATTGVYTPGSSGTGVIRVQDSLGRNVSQTITVEAALSINPDTHRILVNGSRTFSGANGVGPYTYTIGAGSTGSVGVSTGAYVAPAAPATEQVIVTDSLGNTATATITVVPVLSISMAGNKNQVILGGSLTAIGAGGFPPYTYSLGSTLNTSINATTGVFTGTMVTQRMIRVTDSTGASATTPVFIRGMPAVQSGLKVVVGENIIVNTQVSITTPITWEVVTGNGTVTTAGSFTASNTPGLTTVRVTDGEGNSATGTIQTIAIPSITSFSITSTNFNSLTVDIDLQVSDYQEWCILLGIASPDNCVWSNTALPSTFTLPRANKSGLSLYAFTRWGTHIAGAAGSKVFNSKFPLGSTDYFTIARGLAKNSNDEIYVSDAFEGLVHKYRSDGTWLQTWGSKAVAYSAKSNFSVPSGLAVDSSDNFYVADTGNNRIQKFNAQGIFVTSIASPGVRGVAVDTTGNIYATDMTNHKIRIYDSAGNQTREFGTQGSANGQFNQPSNVILDGSGNIFVTEFTNGRVQKFDNLGNWLLTFGSKGTADGQFEFAADLKIDSLGNLLVVDGTTRIQTFTASGAFTSSITIPGESYQSLLIESNGSIIVSDSRRFKRLNLTLNVSSRTSKNGNFTAPRGIDSDSAGNIFVADTGNSRIQKFDASGAWQFSFGAAGTGDGQFTNLTSVKVSADGFIYALDSGNNRVQKFSSTGVWIANIGVMGHGPGYLVSPVALAIDAAGNLYVAVSQQGIINKYDSDGNYLITIGSPGTATGQLTTTLSGVTVDTSGNVYTLEANRIQKFDSSGAFIYSVGSSGSGSDQFFNPSDIRYSSFDNKIYIADSGNRRVQARLATDGAVDSTYFFPSTSSQSVNSVSTMVGITIDNTGALYVSDSYLDRVIKEKNGAALE